MLSPVFSEATAVQAALEAALTALVQAAPHLEAPQLARAADLAVELALHAAEAGAGPGAAERIALACAIERCLDLLVTGAVDPGIALPALVMAAHTAGSASTAAIVAARYEVETLLPVPGKPSPSRGGPDVPLANLLRGAARPPAPVESNRMDRVAASWPEPARAQVAAARERLRLT